MVLAVALTLVAAPGWAQSIRQQTAGWCSPAVADAKGNVSIVCQGVDPKALARLNELLDKKDLELAQKIQEANEWATKYRDLSARLAAAGDDGQLAEQAKNLVQEGKFEQAGALLDRLLVKQETQVDSLAANHFNRAELFGLQFQHAPALPHYEKAFQYRPNNTAYAFAYAFALHRQNHFLKTGNVYVLVLQQYRDLAVRNPDDYRPNVAMTLNNLAILYRSAQRLGDAEAAYKEALAIRRDLAARNPDAYRPDVATTLNNLAILYQKAQRPRRDCAARRSGFGVPQATRTSRSTARSHAVAGSNVSPTATRDA